MTKPQSIVERHAALHAELSPLRAELDALVAEKKITVGERDKRETALRSKIKTLQAELYPIEMDMAACAKALGKQS